MIMRFGTVNLQLAVAASMSVVMSLCEVRAGEPVVRPACPYPGAISVAPDAPPGVETLTLRQDGTITIAQASLSRDASRQNPATLHFSTLDLTPDAVLAHYTSTQISDPPIEAVTGVRMTPDGGIALLGEACVGVIPNYRGDCAREFALSRFGADGNLDTAFGSHGWSLTDVAKSDHNDPRSLAVQPDGKIIASGISLVPYYLLMTAYSFATIRYNADGSVDRDFGDGGRVITRMGSSREDTLTSQLLLPDGRIVVAGTADATKNVPCSGLECIGGVARTDFAIARYLANGRLDKSFGRRGKVEPNGLGMDSAVNTVEVDSRGRLIAAGWVTFKRREPASVAPVVARYDRNGNLDPSFGDNGIMQLDAPSAHPGGTSAIKAQADDKLIVIGHFRSAACKSCSVAMRVDTDGRQDMGFGNHGTALLPFNADPFAQSSVGLQADGKIVLAGLRSLKGDNKPAIVLLRLNANGNADKSFGAPQGVEIR